MLCAGRQEVRAVAGSGGPAGWVSDWGWRGHIRLSVTCTCHVSCMNVECQSNIQTLLHVFNCVSFVTIKIRINVAFVIFHFRISLWVKFHYRFRNFAVTISQDSNPDDPDSIPDLVDHDHMHVVDECCPLFLHTCCFLSLFNYLFDYLINVPLTN